MIDHLGVIAAESERFVAALERAEAHATVPSAPGWSADDLLWHLTEVQWFWAAVVVDRLDDPASAEAAIPARPVEREELARLARSAARALTDALAGAEDGEPVWTWSDDRTVGLVRRRQLHEVVVHRVDAELTAGLPITPIDAEVAADGVDEVFTVFVGGVPHWMTFTPDGTTVTVALDGHDRRWTYAFGRAVGTSPDSGNHYDLPALEAADGTAADGPDATIRGAAADVLLWLWGRGPIEPLTVDGDAAIAARLRELMADATEQ